jgi:hypothetical protein
MFVQELDRPSYLVIEKRGFDDKELPVLSDVELAYILEEQTRANRLQLWLREVYMAGDRAYRTEVPQWVLEGVQNAALQKRQASGQTLKKKSPSPVKQEASATDTNQSG